MECSAKAAGTLKGELTMLSVEINSTDERFVKYATDKVREIVAKVLSCDGQSPTSAEEVIITANVSRVSSEPAVIKIEATEKPICKVEAAIAIGDHMKKEGHSVTVLVDWCDFGVYNADSKDLGDVV